MATTDSRLLQVLSRQNIASNMLLPIGIAATTIAIFVADTITTRDYEFPVLYIAVVLMAARFCRARSLLFIGAGCVALSVVSYLFSPPIEPSDETLFNLLLRIAAIGITTLLVLQGQSAEANLREKASLLDLTHDTVIVHDMNNVITYWNRGAQEQYGWTAQEAVGRTTDDLLRTVYPTPIEAILAQLQRAGRWEGELIHTKRDGTKVVGASRWALQRDRQNRPVAILHTDNDITGRKQAEEALREREKELREVVDTIPAMTIMTLPDGSSTFVSRQWTEYTGLSAEDAKGAGWQAAFHPNDLDRHVSRWRECLASGEPFEDEVRLRRALDGESRWFLARAVPLRDEVGKILRWYTILADIEDRKRAEMLATVVFDSAPDGFAIVGKDYRYQRVNPVYERRTGLPAEKIVGMHVSELYGPEAFERAVKPNLDRFFAGDEEVKYASWFDVQDGPLYLAVSYSPLRLGSERIEGVLVITHDLTVQMRAIEALQAAQAELAHVVRVSTLGELTASIAHEINQPLAAIVTGAGAGLRWLGGDSPNLEEARLVLVRIQNDGNRAAEVISRIRALARKSPMRMDRVAINDIILDVIALMRGELDRNRVTLRTRLADDLPAIQGDRVQLQQVILNLIVNAIEAMHDSESRELLICSGKDETENVLVSVCDSGPGLNPHTIDRIFESFYTTKSAGMGMGLSICRSVIDAHEGRLTARANAPRGAIFEVALPQESADAAATQEHFPAASTH